MTGEGGPDTEAPDIEVEVRVAAAAAAAARVTPGVVRLQPGLWGLVQQLSREAWQRATGQAFPDIGGVEAELDGASASVELTLVVDAGAPAVSVVAAVQRSVTEAVSAATGLRVRSVAVHICEIDLTRLLDPTDEP